MADFSLPQQNINGTQSHPFLFMNSMGTEIHSPSLVGQVPCNWWVDPAYNYLGLLEELERKLQGTRGSIDHKYMYLDPKSAADWETLAAFSHYISFIGGGYPFKWAAHAIQSKLRKLGYSKPTCLDIIALGPGDAQKENRLTEVILEQIPTLEDVNLYLLDISPPLLNLAARNAVKLFQGDSRIKIIPALGDMQDLPRYSGLFYTEEQKKRPCLIIFLGATLGNHTQENAIFRDSLHAFSPNTLFLIDYITTFADPNSPSEIMQNDPYLSDKKSTKWLKALQKFIIGPLRRYKEGVVQARFEPILDNQTVTLPGSYAIELKVTATMLDQSEQSFYLHRIKRYTGEAVVDAVESAGFRVVDGNRFSANREIYLFVKES